jgi:hypothetical protein
VKSGIRICFNGSLRVDGATACQQTTQPTAISGLKGEIVVWRNGAMQAIKLETAVIDLDRWQPTSEYSLLYLIASLHLYSRPMGASENLFGKHNYPRKHANHQDGNDQKN